MARKSNLKNILVLILVVCLLTACGTSRDDSESNELSELLLVLSSRDGVTSSNDYVVLAAAADSASVDFKSELGDSLELNPFTNEISAAITLYRNEYAEAEAGLAGAEGRALAMQHLLTGLYAAMDRHGVDYHAFYLALLHGFAAFDAYLDAAEARGEITPEANEMVDLLQTLALHHCIWTNTVSYYRGSLATLGTDPALIEPYSPLFDMVEEVALNRLTSVEQTLSDPVLLADVHSLVVSELNLEAQFDLLGAKISMEDFFYSSPDMTEIAARMDAAGGVMSGMTTDRLIEAGLYNGSYIRFSRFVALDWVRPEMGLNYQLDPALSDRLAELGGTATDEPDDTVFGEPYLSLFRFEADLFNCNNISYLELSAIQEERFNAEQQLPSMTELLALQLSHEARMQSLRENFSGATTQEIEALTRTLRYPVIYPIR